MNLPLTWVIYTTVQGSGWPGNLHASQFLRVRSPSASTVEGINRAMVEFERPLQDFTRVELHLDGRDSTEAAIDLIGYSADGTLSVADLTGGTVLLTFTQLRHKPTVLDVTEFVRSSQGYVGFRFQLNDEAGAPVGLNVRTEWETSLGLVVYPTCYADCDNTQQTDIFDFLCFQSAFVASNPYACNCDTSTGPGVCDIFDFLCFQDAFVRGCGP